VALLRSIKGRATKLRSAPLYGQNLGELSLVAAEVQQLQPDVWKWYQLRQEVQRACTLETLAVPRSQLENFSYSRLDPIIQVTYMHSYVEQSINAYLIIDPDSEALVPLIDSYVSAGYLLKRETTSPEFR